MIIFVANEGSAYLRIKAWSVDVLYTLPTETLYPGEILVGPRQVLSFAVSNYSDLPQGVINAVNSSHLRCYHAEPFNPYKPAPTWDLDVLMPLIQNLQRSGALHALMTYVSDVTNAEASAHQCVYCKRGRSDHANGQCLFGSTSYFSWAAAFALIQQNPKLLQEKP